MIESVHNLEAPWPSSGSVLDQFNQFSQEEVDKTLAAMKPTTCLLDLHQSWIVKASGDIIWVLLEDNINLSLTSGTFPGRLKEAVVRRLLKKPSLDPR